MGVFLGSNSVSTFGGLDASGNFISSKVDANTNLNDLLNEGMFYCDNATDVATMTNLPLQLPFALLIEKHSGTKQTISFSSTLQTFIRNYDGTTWTNWIQLYNASFPQESVAKLATGRNINGVLFDGTADITITDDTKLLTTDVLNASNVSVAGKALDARQANPNVAGTMAADIATLNENLVSKTSLLLDGVVGSIKTYALALHDTTMVAIYTIDTTTDLPTGSEWKFTTGIIFRRINEINIMLQNYSDGTIATIGCSSTKFAPVWTNWVIK